MRYIPVSLRQLAVDRANSRCEYCGLSQAGQAATFHIDHVMPLTEGGQTREDNLALACVSCSLRKAARLTATDPETGQQTPIYSPRSQAWHEHFRWDKVVLIGLTPTG